MVKKKTQTENLIGCQAHTNRSVWKFAWMNEDRLFLRVLFWYDMRLDSTEANWAFHRSCKNNSIRLDSTYRCLGGKTSYICYLYTVFYKLARRNRGLRWQNKLRKTVKILKNFTKMCTPLSFFQIAKEEYLHSLSEQNRIETWGGGCWQNVIS